MGGGNYIIGPAAIAWTERVREPEGSYQPELTELCCRLPLRNLNE
jgi:hypothetical protein